MNSAVKKPTNICALCYYTAVSIILADLSEDRSLLQHVEKLNMVGSLQEQMPFGLLFHPQRNKRVDQEPKKASALAG